jgi:hypothetical protein
MVTSLHNILCNISIDVISEAIKLRNEAANLIVKKFIDLIKLEFEKILL